MDQYGEDAMNLPLWAQNVKFPVAATKAGRPSGKVLIACIKLVEDSHCETPLKMVSPYHQLSINMCLIGSFFVTSKSCNTCLKVSLYVWH